MAEKGGVRPYWYVDLKWMFGLAFFVLLSVSLLIYVLSVLMAPKAAIPIASYVVASMYSREGLDDATDVETIKAKYLKTSGIVFYPLGGQDVVVTRQELETLSPKELRLRIFRQVVEPIYYQKTSRESLGQYGVLAVLNEGTYKLLRRIFMMMLVPVVMAGIGMVVFSYKLGRLTSLGTVLILVSGLPAAMLLLVQKINPPAGGTGPLSALPRELVVEVAAAIAPVYNGVLMAGVGLLGVAIVLKAVVKVER